MAAGVVHVPWYATGFRGDQLEAELAAVTPIALRYGATSWHVYRYRDDRYKFLQVMAFEDKDDWDRFWNSDEFIDFRVRTSSWFQVPVLYGWTDLVGTGAIAPEPVTSGGSSPGDTGDLAG